MRVAKHFSKFNEQISLFSTQFEEDKAIIPDFVNPLSNLSRSVLDLNPKLKNRKLPLIADILAKSSEIKHFDYLIFTNMDIALMPYFYDVVFEKIHAGHDALVINRRRLSKKYSKIEELPLMYADLGKSHPGFDCFVMHKDLLNQFVLDEICVGISFLEVSLVNNVFSFAKNPLYLPDKHLTFHLGMDVLVPRNNAFYQHNRRSYFDNIQPKIKMHFELKKLPYGSLPWPSRMVKWILNPSLFTRNYLELEGKSTWQKIKARLDEIRWKSLQR